MTPYEIDLLVGIHREKEEAKTEYMISLAWLTANYTRAEKLPTLHEILSKTKEKEPQSDEQMLNTVKMLHYALGGD